MRIMLPQCANPSVQFTFLAFFALFELGSLICGVATSSTMLIVGRAVAGLGMSGLMNGALTIVAGAVPLHKRAALIGIIMGCECLAPGLMHCLTVSLMRRLFH